MKKGRLYPLLVIAFLVSSSALAEPFRSQFPEGTTRHWIGPEYWANRLQDWRMRSGRIECLVGTPRLPMRTVHLLTRALGKGDGDFRLTVRTGNLLEHNPSSKRAWSGFLIGAGAGKVDYRAAALVHHFSGEGGGLIAAFDNRGRAVFRDMSDEETEREYPLLSEGSAYDDGPYPRESWEEIELQLSGVKQAGGYRLDLTARDVLNNITISRVVLENVPEEELRGNIALVSHCGKEAGEARYWFEDFRVQGEKIESHPDRTFGPVLSALYSLSGETLKLSAQFPPLGFGDTTKADLFTKSGNGEWTSRGTAPIEYPGYVARFRVEAWDDSQDHQYQVRYEHFGEGFTYDGTIRANPEDQDEIVIAGFTGNQTMGRSPDNSWGSRKGPLMPNGRYTPESFWFPHSQMIANIPKHDADLLVFTGDQLYEGGCPTHAYRNERNPELDYLYKWIVWGWAYNPITRDRPSIVLIDDHDVWMGNIWGEGGARTPGPSMNDGGYKEHAVFQRTVVRMQCSHNPDPYAPGSLNQGMSAYFTRFVYGGLSFVALEDRSFKSAPVNVVHGTDFHDGKILDPDYDILQADVPDAVLLGETQLDMLEEWAASDKDKIHISLSQTMFGCVQTDWDGSPIKDLDSNGWPQSGRNRALRVLRKGDAFLLAGDQHLAMVTQFGVEEFGDGPFQFGVPAVANKYRRWWLPKEPGANRQEGAPEYTGDFLDGFKNKMTVHAIANSELLPEEILEIRRRQNPKLDNQAYHLLADREVNCDGYGIVKIDKPEKSIAMECWPWNADPGKVSDQFTGWPITIQYHDGEWRLQ